MLTALGVLAAGCDAGGTGSGELWGHAREAAPALVRRVALPVAFEAGGTLSADPRGWLWIGARDTLRAVDPATGTLLLTVPLDTLALRDVPRVLGLANERVYVSAGDELLTLDEQGEVRMRRAGVGNGVVLLDPLERHVYHATENGAVFGLHPRLLRPVWAWPRLGAAATAMASSPEGDRLYLALAPGDGGAEARLLERDVQTGRVLSELMLPAPVRELRATPEGALVALAGAGGVAEVLALRPGPAGLEVSWRRPLAGLGLTAEARLRVAGAGSRLVVHAPGAGGVMRVLDTKSGSPLGEPLETALDADFGSHGTLYLLDRSELRVLQ